MDLINDHFPTLTKSQKEQFSKLQGLYEEWNAKINVISRKDTEHFYEKHVLHSLSIAKICRFKPGAQVLDIGTGGGFPGIPLAILYPEAHFHLVDSIAKKIKVVKEVCLTLGITNVVAEQTRAEDVKGKYDFIISRAVTQMPRFLTWTRGKLRAGNKAGSMANGILYLKGGDLTEELASIPRAKVYPLDKHFETEFFKTKMVVYIKT